MYRIAKLVCFAALLVLTFALALADGSDPKLVCLVAVLVMTCALALAEAPRAGGRRQGRDGDDQGERRKRDQLRVKARPV